MKISNEDIALAAKTLRARQDKGLVTPQNPLKTRRSKTPWIVAAACAAGFVLGIGVSPLLSPTASDTRLAQTTAVQVEEPRTTNVEPQVITQVVHDTIYETRIVRVPTQQVMTAQAEPAPESPGCSMLCDDIPYDLLAGNN